MFLHYEDDPISNSIETVSCGTIWSQQMDFCDTLAFLRPRQNFSFLTSSEFLEQDKTLGNIGPTFATIHLNQPFPARIFPTRALQTSRRSQMRSKFNRWNNSERALSYTHSIHQPGCRPLVVDDRGYRGNTLILGGTRMESAPLARRPPATTQRKQRRETCFK